MKFFNKAFLTFGAACCIAISAMADDTTGKPNVLIDYFSYPSNVGSAEANELRNFVIEGINATQRVDLIDVNTNDLLKLEEERREEGVDAAGDADRLKVMAQEGANALIQGEITGVTIEERKLDDGTPYYKAVIAYTLKVVDPNSGKVIHSKAITHGNDMLNTQSGDTPKQAFIVTAKNAVRAMRPFIETAFPVNATILEANEIKKDEIKSVYISVGSEQGVNKGNLFEICVERQIAGRTSHNVIGELEVEAVEGADISMAKVKKGGKELKVAMDNGQTIVLKSKAKKRSFLDQVKDNI